MLHSSISTTQQSLIAGAGAGPRADFQQPAAYSVVATDADAAEPHCDEQDTDKLRVSKIIIHARITHDDQSATNRIAVSPDGSRIAIGKRCGALLFLEPISQGSVGLPKNGPLVAQSFSIHFAKAKKFTMQSCHPIA